MVFFWSKKAIAREEKGWLLGVDYNKSPTVSFATSTTRTKSSETGTRSGFAVYAPTDPFSDDPKSNNVSTNGRLEGEPDKTLPRSPPKDHTTMIIIVVVTCVAVVVMLILLCVCGMRCLRQYRDGPEEIEHALN